MKNKKQGLLKAPNAIAGGDGSYISTAIPFAVFSQNGLLSVGNCLEMIGNYF